MLNVLAVFKYMHLFQLSGPPSSTINQDVSFCLPTLAWLYGMHSLLLGPLLAGGATVMVSLQHIVYRYVSLGDMMSVQYEHGASKDHVVKSTRKIISKVNVTHLFTVPHFLSEFVKDVSSCEVQLVFNLQF